MLRILTPLPSRLAGAMRHMAASSTTATATTATLDASLTALGRSIFFGTHRAEVTFLVGGPGSGKGTVSAMARKRLGFEHVSVGELLRAEMQSGTPLGTEVGPIVSMGGMVPSTVSVQLLLAHLERALSEKGARERTDEGHVMQWIIDGFPRKVSSAEMWERLGFQPKRVLALEVGEEVMRRRLGLRGRMDDVPNVVRERIEKHYTEWRRLREFYRSRGLLTAIDASGSPEEVWQRFLVAVGTEYGNTHS